MAKARLLNINYLNKYREDLMEIPGVSLKNTNGYWDSEWDYDVYLNDVHVAAMITDADTGLIKYFQVNKNFKNAKLLN